MLPALQPSRPKVQRPPPSAGLPHQQKRAVRELPQQQKQQQPTTGSQVPPKSEVLNRKPRNQIEAMPPFNQAQALKSPSVTYNSAIRHPVFFTERLRKPPFPIPEVVGNGFSPVASGYIMERRRIDGPGVARTKL